MSYGLLTRLELSFLKGADSISFLSSTENKSKRELIRMLVQKGYESDPVAAWSKAQEKVQQSCRVTCYSRELVNQILGEIEALGDGMLDFSDRLRKKTLLMGMRATAQWIPAPLQVPTSTTFSTCLCGA